MMTRLNGSAGQRLRGWRARIGLAGTTSPMLRSVGLLLSGAALGQAVNFIALPFLTRVYTPAEFNVLALFAALAIICSLGACLGFDLAIPMARSRRDAVRLLGCALLSVLAISTVVGMICATLLIWSPSWIVRWPVQVFALLPLCTFVVGTFNAVAGWTLRGRRFSILARAGVHQAVWGSMVQIALGALGAGVTGLLVGYMLISGLGIVQLAFAMWRNDRPTPALMTWVGMRAVARRYATFFKFTSVEAFANACSVYAPMLLISALTVGPEMGFVMLAQRLLQAPLMLVGRSVSSVYTAHVAQLYRAGQLGPETAGVLRTLLGLVCGPLLFAAMAAPELASLALGTSWRPVGIYVAWLMPWALLHFLSSSVLTTMHARGRNAAIMALTITGLVFRLTAVGAAGLIDPRFLVHAYAVSGAVYYGAQMLILLAVNDVRLREIVPRSRLAVLNLTGFLLAGLAFTVVA